MSWYYADKGERCGPVSDGEFNALLKANVITATTLVWQEGMPQWRPYAELAKDAAPPQEPVETQAWELVEPDAATLEQQAKGITLSVNHCVWRAIQLLKSHFMLSVGTTFIVYSTVVLTQLVPVLGALLGSILNGPLMGGLFWFFLLLIRGKQASFSDGLAGFSRNFLQLALCALFSGLAVALCMLPGTSQLGLAEMIEKGSAPNFSPTAVLLLILGGVAAIYLTVAWIFALPLVIDKGLSWREGLSLSRRVATRHWWRLFLILPAGGALAGLVLVATLAAVTLLNTVLDGLLPKALLLLIEVILASLAMGGVACLLPVFFGALMYAYEDLFGERKRSNASEPALEP